MSTPDPAGPRSPWQRIVGEVDRIGWWTLPVFLAVGLAGAVMAGALAVVYYSQQVADLEAETRQARQDLQEGVAAVEEAREEALAEIDDRVDAVRDALDEELPIEDVRTLGLVVVEARVNTPAPPSATVRPDPPPAGAGTPAGAPLAQGQQPTEAPPATEGPTEPVEPTEPTEPAPAPPSPPPVVPRLGVGFAVAVEGGQTFVATSFGLVADPDARAGVVEEVVLTTMDGQQAAGVVHSWDESRDLALVRAPVGDLPVATWRPRDEPVEADDAVTVVGLTPRAEPVDLRGTVVLADVELLVTTLPDVDFLRGAPILDRTGRVVAVYTPGYQPFGAAAGERQAMAPVGLFCERMLNGCERLEAEATASPADPEG